MRKRAAASTKSLSKATSSLLSPLPSASTDRGASKLSKPSYDFDFSSKSKTLGVPSPLIGSPAGGISKAPSKISDLRDLASSHTDGLKKYLDLSHSEVLKEAEASKTRIAKRFKIQTQACTQLTEEVEKDFKKISDRISENAEVMKDSYAKIISEVQASTSRVSKVIIPELAQSLEKGFEGLRSRYKIAGTPVLLNVR